MPVLVVSQCRSHRATVQVWVVRSARDCSSRSLRAASAARRWGSHPGGPAPAGRTSWSRSSGSTSCHAPARPAAGSCGPVGVGYPAAYSRTVSRSHPDCASSSPPRPKPLRLSRRSAHWSAPGLTRVCDGRRELSAGNALADSRFDRSASASCPHDDDQRGASCGRPWVLRHGSGAQASPAAAPGSCQVPTGGYQANPTRRRPP
jgi:hypothetical protein